MAAVLTTEAIRSGAAIMHNMTDSDLEFVTEVAHEAGLGPSGVSARDRYVGEGNRLPAGGEYTFTGAHGTIRPIDVVDDDVDIPSGQPDRIDDSGESLIAYVEAEPGRQASGSFSDDGGSGAPLAADSVGRQVLDHMIEQIAHASGAIDSVGDIGVGADADGLWAADSAGAVRPADFPLTQHYDEDGVNPVGSADPPASIHSLAEAEADPIANTPALAEVESADPGGPRDTFGGEPSLYEGGDDSDGANSLRCLGRDRASSEAESTASTRAPSMSGLPPVTYFPSFASLPLLTPMCQKCGREVEPIATRLKAKAGEQSIGRWKCGPCNSRHVQAVTLFGEWPTAAFLAQSTEQQTKFWTEEGKTSKELEANVLKNVIRKDVQRRTAENKGTYQPLSWYKNNHYDTDKIEQEITDKKEVKGLGLCYKVFFESESFASIEEQCLKQLKEMKEGKDKIQAAKRLRKELGNGASASSAVVAPSRKRERSSSSDSSSSSSQSRKKRKSERRAAKRKAAEPEITPEELAEQEAAAEKKQKLADKEAEKTAKEAEKTAKKAAVKDAKKARIAEAASQKQLKQTRAIASKMVVKLAPAIRNLQGALSDPNIQHVVAFTRDAAKESLVSCLEIHEEMSRKKGEAQPEDLTVDIDEVETLQKKAVQDAKDVNASLALIMKFRNRGAEK